MCYENNKRISISLSLGNGRCKREKEANVYEISPLRYCFILKYKRNSTQTFLKT